MGLKLSVAIPNYNHGHLLERALDSVFSQSRQPDEVVVGDDASTDDSLQILARYQQTQPNLKVIAYSENAGPMNNTLRVYQATCGDYIYGLSADDYILPGFFEAAMQMLTEYPLAGSCVCDLTMVWPDGIHHVRSLGCPPGYLSPSKLGQLLKRNDFYILGVNSLYRRDLVLSGYIWPEAQWNWDWLTANALAQRTGICYLGAPYQHFQVGVSTWSSQGHASQESYRALELILEILNRQDFDDIREAIRDSAALAVFGPKMLEVILPKLSYWRYLSAPLVRRTWLPFLKWQLVKRFPILRSLRRK